MEKRDIKKCGIISRIIVSLVVSYFFVNYILQPKDEIIEIIFYAIIFFVTFVAFRGIVAVRFLKEKDDKESKENKDKNKYPKLLNKNKD